MVSDIGMPVIPLNELLCPVTSRKVFARYAKPTLGRSSGGVYDRVIKPEQIRTSDVYTETYIADKSHERFVVE
jgi:hypothetical protein